MPGISARIVTWSPWSGDHVGEDHISDDYNREHAVGEHAVGEHAVGEHAVRDRLDGDVRRTSSEEADGPDDLDSEGHRSATAALAKALAEDVSVDSSVRGFALLGEAAAAMSSEPEAPELCRPSHHPESGFCFVNPRCRPARGI